MFNIIFMLHELLKLHRLEKDYKNTLYIYTHTFIYITKKMHFLCFSLRAPEGVWFGFNPVCRRTDSRHVGDNITDKLGFASLELL